MRRFLTVFSMVAIATAAFAAPVSAQRPSSPTRGGSLSAADLQPTKIIQGNKSSSGQIAQSDAGLLARNDGAMVNVLIKFDADAIASYRGNVAGLAATSPSITGKSLKESGATAGAYARYLGTFARLTRGRITAAVPQANLGRNFLTAFGGVSARMPANKAKDLLKVKGVAAVMYDSVEQPLTDASPAFVGADQVWPSIGGNQKAGQGVKVGIIDTGIWPEHPSFGDPGISHPGGTYGCEFGDGIDPAFGDDFTCNDKLIGAYAFLETAMEFTTIPAEAYCNAAQTECSARDADGHGTHTSSTAAGRRLASAELFGVERGPVSGIAPGAHVIHYRVCIDGCYSSDSMDAVEQAIIDDVDVINFSISGGSNPYTDGVELAFLDAYAAGILVNASAGNDGPGAATANHGGPWVNTVGASTSDRHFLTTLHLTADNSDTLDIEGVTVTDGISSPTAVVAGLSAPYSSELCTAEADGTDGLTGMIVACQRGSIARVEKGYNVLQGGAVGMILYNVSVTDLETDNHFLPTVHVNDAGQTIEAFLAGHTGVMAEWDTGVASAVPGDVMASFSSRGPLGDFIKPDVTAPGVQILAGASPDHLDDPAGGLGPDGELFQAIAGTSMSSPHAAGVAAILKASHPNWTPGQIKSAMMTASVQSVLKEDGATAADPFDRGAGSIRANRANKPVVTFDVTSAAYFGGADDPDNRIHLNLPSINAPNMPGVITTMRTAKNVSGTTQTFRLTATGPGVSVTPKWLTIPNNHNGTFTVRIDAPHLADGQYFGQVKLDPQAAGANDAVLPVAFNKGPGDVHFDHSCASGSVADEATIECSIEMTNFDAETAHVSARVKGPTSSKLKLSNWSAGNKKGNGFLWNGTLAPSIPPTVDGLLSPGDGFFDISFLGGEGFYGDETTGVYDFSAFGGGVAWGDLAYGTVSVTSNGYLQMGEAEGGSEFVPQDMPDPANPNAVLAPYWTDLNLEDAGDITVAVDNDGINYTYIVVQWTDAPIWGSCDTACEYRTFQIWMGTKYFADTYNGGMSYITYEYPGAMGPGAGNDNGVIEDDGLNVGAEDINGNTGADLGIDVEPAATGYFVDIGPSSAGGTMTITYDVKGKKPGTHKIIGNMTSDVSVGTAKDVVFVTVTP